MPGTRALRDEHVPAITRKRNGAQREAPFPLCMAKAVAVLARDNLSALEKRGRLGPEGRVPTEGSARCLTCGQSRVPVSRKRGRERGPPIHPTGVSPQSKRGRLGLSIEFA
jgi:hypothetical protein